MTQPDGLMPDSAFNADSLAALAAKTQEDWEAQLRGDITARFAGASAGFSAILAKIPIIGDIIEILTGVEDGNTSDLGTWVNNLTRNLWNALTNLIHPSRLPVVPVSHIGDTAQNLLLNPDFSDSSALSGSTDWVYDGTQTHTGSGGSAKSLGFNKFLLSNPVDVTAGQKFAISAWTKYSSVSATSGQNAIRVSVIAYLAGAQVSTSLVAGVASPSGTAGWTQLSGTYTVPAGVDAVRVQLGVTSAMTAGTVWFDDVDAHKTGLMPQNLVDKLLNGWNNFWDGIFGTSGSTSKTVDDMLTAAASLSANANTALTNAGNALTQLTSLISNAAQSTIGAVGAAIADTVTNLQNTWNNFWDGIFGTSGSTGKTTAHFKTAAASVASTANTAASNASTAISSTTAIATNVYNGWYGSGGTGATSQVTTTVAAIKTTIAGGWTVETLTTSGTWTRPAPVAQILEFWAVCIGSGGGGGKGSVSGSLGAGGVGAAGGGYVAQQVNPADIPSTVSYTIGAGAAGSGSGTPAAGNATSFGSLATSASATTASIASLFGFYDASASAPGHGGDGGDAKTGGASTASTDGGSTPLASGGTGGTLRNPGGGGGTASLTGQTRAGGGGGGGGGAGPSSPGGGAGGAGGFPGGGGGGGGGALTGFSAGSGGTGGNGVIILLYRTAA